MTAWTIKTSDGRTLHSCSLRGKLVTVVWQERNIPAMCTESQRPSIEFRHEHQAHTFLASLKLLRMEEFSDAAIVQTIGR